MANMDKWKSEEMKLTPQTWFGDSAASTHMCNDDTNLYDYDVIREEIKVGSGKTIVATKIGKLKLRVKQTNGKVIMMVLTKVKFVPELWCNLFSLTAAMDKGFDLGNQGRIITVTHGSTTIGFDRIFPTSSGFIMAAEMEQMTAEGAYAVLEAGREISIAKFHEMYAHPGEAIPYNLKLQSKLEKCENCALAKSRQANISKEPVDRSEVPGEELMIDISSVKKKSAGGNKFWLQVMDNASDFIFSMFLKKKSETSAKMIALVKDLNAKGFKVKKIRCDRAGENMKFQDEAKNEGRGLTFEFTAPNTPQRNGRVKRKFATAFGRVRAMMNTARMTETMRGNLWAEAADTATKLDTALVYQRGEQSSHQKFWKREARFARHLRTFGEMAVIKVHTKIKGKLKDRGRTVMFVGYADNSSGDTYKFYDPKTKRISSSRDVSWLNKSYGDWKGIKKTNTLRLTQEILLETVHDNDITQAPTTHTNDANTTAPEPGPIPTAAAPAETATIPAVQLDSGANPQRAPQFGPTPQPATTTTARSMEPSRQISTGQMARSD
ncbi:unnamed protein product [Cylindrotheca closterium]|uniref:Integrase catalytic domain-containing protein n=1 Tax=Cylindrotheca closterium TaxID=2856 RepID=A0AAD2FJS3_9STRA|nr:unnamed protein product [Cylindrotheca closterium]